MTAPSAARHDRDAAPRPPTTCTTSTPAWPSQTVPRLRKRKTITRRRLPPSLQLLRKRCCPRRCACSPAALILGCFAMIWCTVLLVAHGTIGGGLALARMSGGTADGSDGGGIGGGIDGDSGGAVPPLILSRRRDDDRRNGKRGAPNPPIAAGDEKEEERQQQQQQQQQYQQQRLRGASAGEPVSHTNHGDTAKTLNVYNGDNNEAGSKNNPYEGWQPLPPVLPHHSQQKCSWRQCLDPTGKAAGSRYSPACTSYCLEDEADLRPVPPVVPPVPPPSGSNGGAGQWIPDVETVRRMYLKGRDANGNVFPPPLDRELCEPMGPRGQQKTDVNLDMLNAVNVRISPEPTSTTTRKTGEGAAVASAAAATRPTRILCMVYTMADAHPQRIRAIRETWAGRCDGFLAFSTANDPRIPAISLEHDGPEAYGNMWQKVRSIWKFVGEHYVDDGASKIQQQQQQHPYFDFFFLGGDDLFVIPENLRSYLSTLGSPDDHHFVGRRFKGYGKDNYFNSGGAGYALSRGLVKKYYEVLDHPDCAPHQKTSMEDVNTAACLRKVLGVGLTDTRDERGRERFHPFAPGTHYNYKPGADHNMAWYEDYNKEWGILQGADCCAPDSVSFHYIKKATMVRHIYKLLYDSEDCK